MNPDIPPWVYYEIQEPPVKKQWGSWAYVLGALLGIGALVWVLKVKR